MERKLKRFNILLDDESLLYFPGSFLTGKVLLELDENTPATGLFFHIIGEGVVKLQADGDKSRLGGAKTKQQQQQQKADKKRRPAVLTDRENYIDFRMRLLGDGPELGAGLDGQHTAATGSDRDSCLSSSHDDLSLAKTTSDEDDELGDERTRLRAGNQKILVLSPGVHTFPFKLGLPPNLPSTFLSEQAFVQYYCRAVLREPSGLIHKNQQVFIIINPIDLNQEPAQLQQPFYCEAEERVRSSAGCIGSPGVISCRVRLDRGAFVPGESISVSASIENSSKLTIKKTRAFLAETVEYRAKSQVAQSETRELCSVERGKIGARCTDVWKKELLHIPALPPTNLRGCHLIKIHYDVFFQIITKGSKKPIELQLPIVMATYPVRNKDGTLKRRKGASYPDSLPIFRPWMSGDTLQRT